MVSFVNHVAEEGNEKINCSIHLTGKVIIFFFSSLSFLFLSFFFFFVCGTSVASKRQTAKRGHESKTVLVSFISQLFTGGKANTNRSLLIILNRLFTGEYTNMALVVKHKTRTGGTYSPAQCTMVRLFSNLRRPCGLPLDSQVPTSVLTTTHTRIHYHKLPTCPLTEEYTEMAQKKRWERERHSRAVCTMKWSIPILCPVY